MPLDPPVRALLVQLGALATVRVPLGQPEPPLDLRVALALVLEQPAALVLLGLPEALATGPGLLVELLPAAPLVTPQPADSVPAAPAPLLRFPPCC